MQVKLDKLKMRIERTQKKMKEDEIMFHSLSPSTYGWDESICLPSCPEDRDLMYLEKHYGRLNQKLLKYQTKLSVLLQNAS